MNGFVFTDQLGYDLIEYDVDTKTGEMTSPGSIKITPAYGTTVLGAQWDSTLNGGDGGWRILVANPL